MRNITNNPQMYSSGNTLTISTAFLVHKQEIKSILRLALKKTYKKGQHRKTFVSLFGDTKNYNHASISYHISFHRHLEAEEKEKILDTVVYFGRKNKWIQKGLPDSVLVKWVVNNTYEYLHRHPQIHLFERIC